MSVFFQLNAIRVMLNNILALLKGYSTQKWKFCHHLLTLKFLSSAEHKVRYLEERLVPKSCLAPLISIGEKKILWKSMVPKFQSFFKISSFVFSRQKKLIQVCNNLRVSEWWQHFHFWVEYPFKLCNGIEQCTSFWSSKKHIHPEVIHTTPGG